MADELLEAVQRVIQTGTFVLGPELSRFEASFASYVNAAHAVGTGNGLDALVLALEALDIGRGDDVLVPSNTFIATWFAVTRVGARPIPIEPESGTWNVTAHAFERGMTKHTKAVIPVHLYGQPCAMDEIVRWADGRGVAVIEDAAQAHGARHRGRRIGAHGQLVCFSFYPGKNLGALGDGGAVTTNDPELARRVRMLRNYGGLQKYEHAIPGHNSRLDEIQAAVLSAKLERLDAWNARRGVIARRYLNAFHGLPGLGLPVVVPSAEPVWHLFVVTHAERDALREHLANAGIATSIHYPTPPHLTPAYRSLGIPPGSLPIAERCAREVLSLPMGPHLGNVAVERVIQEVRKFCQRSTT
jgi:dTDP-3-amino-3,4,6-trideoxy-alpha-D-glucose transaminase